MIFKMSNLLFIFVQTFFIFKYANILINYGKNASTIGLMHILSTNFSVLIRTIVSETVSEIRNHNVNLKNYKNSKLDQQATFLNVYKILLNELIYFS